MKHKKTALHAALKNLPEKFEGHCRRKGLRESTIHRYMQVCTAFLQLLEDTGVTDVCDIGADGVSAACLSLSNYDLSTLRIFLRYLFENHLTERDYSYIVPSFKRPQPLPSVYSAEEIHRIECAIGTTSRCCKRNYAMVLLATRLGLRSEDIVLMTFDDLDFTAEHIRITQKKTEAPLLLPMLSEVKAAVLEYIYYERVKAESPYVFLKRTPPFTPISSSHLTQVVRRVSKSAGINPGGRRIGPQAFRSSLASSMIDDNIPYDAVRKVLGHSSQNAIKSYARLDIEQLRQYALEVPAATGAFANFLYGRKQK